jgi:uncharacterized protein
VDLILPFITGLTTGGLSCLAVQGGLLASSVAHEVEQSVKDQPARPGKAPAKAVGASAAGKGLQTGPQGRKRQAGTNSLAANSAQPIRPTLQPEPGSHAAQPRAARPIVLFLSAKLVAYTILGFFLGLLGSVLQLSAMTRAMLQVAIGVFMVGTALRMFNVHPIFRYFSLEPPRFVTRYIRQKSKGDGSAVTPLFLGALTILIPCGITQAMMAVAMGTGSAVAGAVTMFAFILGTSPVFFAIAYLATRLGSRLEAGFMRFVAVVVLALGLISIDAGLTLAGWPYSVSNLRLAMSSGTAVAEAATVPGEAPEAVAARLQPILYGKGEFLGPPSPNAGAADASQPVDAAGPGAASVPADGVVTINVVNSGYQPKVSHARAGQALKMALVTKNTGGCARAFVIPTLGIQQVLPRTGTTMVDLPAQQPGTKLFYSCSMGMYSGVIIFDA